MIVVDSRGRRISDLAQWRSLIFDGTPKIRHWKKGRSAHSLAEFITGPQRGGAYLEWRLSSALSRHVELESATPEYLARFDSYRGNPSNLDLGIIGDVGCEAFGSSLFVGMEAKVDETFGSTVESRYRSALKARRDGKRTNAPERVEDLLSKYFSGGGPPDVSRFANIRYQLLTGAAGTLAASGDVSVFYILVFRTSMYDEERGLANRRDYERFVESARGRALIQEDRGFRADELMLDGKRLVCIDDHVDL